VKRLIIACYLILLLPLFVFPLEETITLGREDNWKDISMFENTRLEEGRGGFYDIVLRDGEYEETPETDLVLHFNSPADLFTMSGYDPIDTQIAYSTAYRSLGTAAAAFRNESDILVFSSGRDTIFSPLYAGGDFSIEFRLYPARPAEGESIILWEGSYVQDGTVYPQKLECGISGRKLLWRLDNFFRSADGRFLSIELFGTETLLPRQWNHHLLRYDSRTGLLEYILNGIPEAITYTTDTGREEPVVYNASPGSSEEGILRIGKNFVGLMDELRISRSFIEDPFLETYPQRTGTAVTRVFDLGYSNSRLLSITSDRKTPENTSVRYFYRVSDSLLTRNSLPGQWKEFFPGRNLEFEARGRYVQVMTELFPEGTGSHTPRVSNLEIHYEPDLPPLPPSRVSAKPGDRSIDLSWRDVIEADVAGYLVYYGIKPGNYFGTGLPAGDSPIDVGKNTSLHLEGLENGKLYYFAVVTYDSSSPPHFSRFSEEISSRPSAVHGTGP